MILLGYVVAVFELETVIGTAWHAVIASMAALFALLQSIATISEASLAFMVLLENRFAADTGRFAASRRSTVFSSFRARSHQR